MVSTPSKKRLESQQPPTKSRDSQPAKTKAAMKTGATKASKASPAAPYTKPELREKIKKQVTAGSKGGQPGQWSARKAQLVAHEYEAEGGGYRGGRRKTQQHLEEWTKEKWRTQDGKPARRNGTMKRYLPDEAWQKLSVEERTKTEAKKARGTREGKQFVANSDKAAAARREVEAASSAKKTERKSSTPKKPVLKKSTSRKPAAKKASAPKSRLKKSPNNEV